MIYPSYDKTYNGLMEWAKSELEHIGRIASIKDKKVQYAYALSTVNGMLYLRDAIKEYIVKENTSCKKKDLLKLHGQVIRAAQHLINEYSVNRKVIEAFNTGKILSSLNDLKWKSNNYKKTQRNKKINTKTRKNRNY